MRKGAIFDLDGTIVDTVQIHDKAWEQVFLNHNALLNPEELSEHTGRKNIDFIQQILTKRNLNTLDPENLVKEKDRILFDILLKEPPPVFSGMLELLEMLQKNGVKLALATSATQQTALVLGKDVMSYFPIKVFAGDVAKGKPDPEIFLLAAEQINLNVADCVVFEDSENGIEAAKSGGFYCIAKDNNTSQNLSMADLVIKEYNVERLKKALLS